MRIITIFFILPSLVSIISLSESIIEFYEDLLKLYTRNLELDWTQDKGYGLYAKKSFNLGETVIEIPKSLSISSFSDIPCTNVFQGLSRDSQLIIKLIYYHCSINTDTHTRYIKSFPSFLPNFPFWNKTHWNFLKNHKFSFEFPLNDPFFLSDYSSYIKILQSHQILSSCMHSIENWKWGISMILSRAFLYNVNNTEELLIAPILDLANYDPSYVEKFWSGYKVGLGGELILRAERNFAENEEFVWSYGRKDKNIMLLMFYGFAVENNPYDYLQYELGDEKSCLEEWTAGKCIYKIKRNEINANLLKAIRVKKSGEEVKKIVNLKDFFEDLPSESEGKESKKSLIESMKSYMKIFRDFVRWDKEFEKEEYTEDQIYREIVKYLKEERKIVLYHYTKMQKLLLKLMTTQLNISL
ncbi:unnamed protein product [Blepharisma stoltei]|uniref:SET domain-containing protein n=1 Tax=Blepharisma stoltei TaxID=1481888 RepID=A0AAU9J1G9_9CILI|nr:unnamed protein product [Blepharisma stoltei]